MASANTPPPQYTQIEVEWLREFERRLGRSLAQNEAPASEYAVGFDALRWCYAYDGDLALAVRKFERHLRVRRILALDEIETATEADNLGDVLADSYAPINFLGNASFELTFSSNVYNTNKI